MTDRRGQIPLIHIGYHKTGTSWLQGFLFRNSAAGFMWTGKRADGPANRLVAASPLDFDPVGTRDAFDPSFVKAAKHGLVPVVSLERLSGHPFSGGYDSKEIACRLADVFPGGRILVVIREQRSMIVSTYKQYVRAGGALRIESFLQPPVYKNERVRVPQFDLGHFEYHRLIALYRELFGPEAVLVLAYEQMDEDPREFVSAIGRFAGAPLPRAVREQLAYDERPNRARSGVSVLARRLVNRGFVRADVNPAPLFASARVAALLARGLPAADAIAPSAVQNRIEQRLRDRVQALVGDRYAESNRLASEAFEIDLRRYGYATA